MLSQVARSRPLAANATNGAARDHRKAQRKAQERQHSPLSQITSIACNLHGTGFIIRCGLDQRAERFKCAFAEVLANVVKHGFWRGEIRETVSRAIGLHHLDDSGSQCPCVHHNARAGHRLAHHNVQKAANREIYIGA